MFHNPTFLPDIPTREQVLFSWALGEAYSPRWRQTVLDSVSGSLKEKLEHSIVEDFTEEEQAMLIAELCNRRAGLIEAYITPANRFRITRLSPQLLGNIPVFAAFGRKATPVSLRQYIADRLQYTGASTAPVEVAKTAMANPVISPYCGLPIIAFCDELGCDVLIDGYARCITALWRMEKGESFAAIPVIYCER